MKLEQVNTETRTKKETKVLSLADLAKKVQGQDDTAEKLMKGRIIEATEAENIATVQLQLCTLPDGSPSMWESNGKAKKAMLGYARGEVVIHRTNADGEVVEIPCTVTVSVMV